MRKLKKSSLVLMLTLCFMFTAFPAQASVPLAPAELKQVNQMVAEQLAKAKIPHVSIAVIQETGRDFLSYAYDGAGGMDENTLFQLGSTSKAFTGLAILLLQDEGQLSLKDPVSRYIPWITVLYDGSEVNPDDFTIANLVYQNSGFTNDEAKYPRATGDMTLEENIRNITGTTLSFYPSERYAYANTNYYLLGYIIEVVSGQNYQQFMHDRIFTPLGLHHTYASSDTIGAEETQAGGSRISFLSPHPYELPVTPGNVPAGYIQSNAADLSRWAEIQLGEIEVSEQFSRIIQLSHQPNPESVVNDHTTYACGWFVNEQTNEIYHSGGTPNYSSRITLRPDDNMAVCVLTNMNASANTEAIAANILAILDGTGPAPYQNDIWTLLDFIFTVISAACGLGILVLILVLIRAGYLVQNGRYVKRPVRKIALKLVLPVLLVLLSVFTFVLLPAIFGADWSSMLLWGPPSILTGCILLLVFSLLMAATVLALSQYRRFSK